MKTINGTEFVLLDRIYLQDIEKKAPAQVPACLEQLARCGHIIAFPRVNKYIGCYEPITTECILDDIYYFLKHPLN